MPRIFRSLRPFVLPLAFATALCAQDKAPPKAANSADHPVHSPGQKRKIKGVPNFGEVTPTLFRGAQPSSEGFKALAAMGVDIVVDARGDRAATEGKEVGQLGMQYFAIPWHCASPHDEVFAKFLKLLQDNPDKKVFLHCRLGEDRTGMMVASYRMAEQGWTADEAMQEMRRFGFSSVHHYLCPGLASYEKKFPERLKSSPLFQNSQVPAKSPPQ